MPMNDIILIAIKEEAPELADLPNVFFTGVGKVNAATVATEVILKHKPQRIINFGTAGGITVQAGLHRCTKFVQRDMDCRALGFEAGITPFDRHNEFSFGSGGITCATGDNFVNGSELLTPADVVDMEAFAIAKACHDYEVEFVCWKYVTDQADESAHLDWNSRIAQGEQHYIQQLKALDSLDPLVSRSLRDLFISLRS